VLFPLSTPLSHAVVAPLVRELARDPSVEILVTARYGGKALAQELLPGAFRWVTPLLAPFVAVDAVVCPGYHFRSRRAAQLVEMFHGVSPKNYAVRKESQALRPAAVDRRIPPQEVRALGSAARRRSERL